MNDTNDTGNERHYVKKEPKFCKCRLCHEYFYAETLKEAQQTCQAHAESAHPGWELSACYCPD
jgi:Zn finger protein HypA/HybF involved in hydrogenase expression